MNAAIAIFVGGGLGSLLRYGVSKVSISIFSSSFPFGTLISNCVSCLVLGIFLGFVTIRPDANQYRYLIAVGFCGGFSTFSSFSAETLELIRHGSLIYAGLNIAFNIVVCILTIGIGTWFARSLYH
jgi:CrcB protein